MNRRYGFFFCLTFILLLLISLWNIFTGSVDFSFKDLPEIFSGSSENLVLKKILMEIRLPRILAAILLGGALSVSGFLLQTFFGNPIAGPFVLGISSGAKLFVAITMIFLLNAGIEITSLGMVTAAFTGSLIAMTIVLVLSLRVKNMSVLVVCGILVGYICSAVTDFFVTFASDSNIVNLHNWSLGSFSGTNWNDVSIITILISSSLLISFIFSKPISAYQLGENYARNMGVNIKALRIILILLSTLLSGCVTAFAGPISFVGIAVPHLVKSIAKTAKPLILIPGCFLAGGTITLFCDGIARSVFAPTELSISTVTAFFLVPVVIYMMVSKKGGTKNV
ncbi:iron ABC transporter permease [Treponema sp.]|uniref:FecCD family ABC transporter permease n=1 Tax=Treponema sp. TaxID=166 RepID=UPI00298E003F|nr:iron ABC transporter permease [Treponema sp.]MCQ2240049.1 iron ABC transporter permease [Treponema sp.]